MTLLETKTTQWYQVEEIHEWENVQRRLEALGILEGTRVQVLKRLHDHPCPRNQMGTGKGNRRGN